MFIFSDTWDQNPLCMWNYLEKFRAIFIPTKEKWNEIFKAFEKKSIFSNCLGALDGKNIRLIQPEHIGSLFSDANSIVFCELT